jgi:hypothetical protein
MTHGPQQDLPSRYSCHHEVHSTDITLLDLKNQFVFLNEQCSAHSIQAHALLIQFYFFQ